MALFRRNNQDQGVSQVEFQDNSGRSWPALLLYLAIAIIIALILVFGGRWLYRTLKDNDSVRTPSTTEQPTQQPQPSPQSPATPAPQPAPSPSPAPTTPSPSPSPTPGSPGRGGQLPDNGPGEVLALFVGTTLAATGLHYLARSRQISRS